MGIPYVERRSLYWDGALDQGNRGIGIYYAGWAGPTFSRCNISITSEWSVLRNNIFAIIWRSDIRRFHLRGSDLETSSNDLTRKGGQQDSYTLPRMMTVTGEFPSQIQWREAVVFSLICAWTNGWANHRVATYLRRHRAHYVVTVMGSHTLSVYHDEASPAGSPELPDGRQVDQHKLPVGQVNFVDVASVVHGAYYQPDDEEDAPDCSVEDIHSMWQARALWG